MPDRKPAFRERSGSFALAAAALIVPLLVAEVTLRIAFWRSMDFGMEMWKYARSLKQPVSDPRLGFVHRPDASGRFMGVEIRTNSIGLRNPEVALPKKDGTYRILILGDSTTLGWGVAENLTAPRALEEQLNRQAAGSGKSFEVVNAGVGNYDTVQEVRYYEEYGWKLAPDLVVLQYFVNDPEPPPIARGNRFLDSLYLTTFLKSRLDIGLRAIGARPDWKAYYLSLYDERNEGWRLCQEALHRLAAETAAHGSKLVVGLLPELREINGRYPFEAQYREVARIVSGDGVPAIPLIDGLRNHGDESTLWVSSADDHPNAKANSLIAAQLKDWVLSHVAR